MFISAHRDIEASRYRIMSGLKKIHESFAHNRIYPTLGDLIELHTTLQRIAKNSGEISGELPKQITGIDIEKQRIIYEPIELKGAEIKAIEELIAWAIPEIQQAIEAGKTIFNFVDDNLKMEGVGIVPAYIEEGYLLVPDVKSQLLHVMQYEVTIYTGADQKYRNLKTTSLRTLPLNTISTTAGNIKLELIRTNRELPNPATYLFETELDFPFTETILPVAKRKLLRTLYS